MSAKLWIPGPLPGMNEIVEAAKGGGGTGSRYVKLKRQWTETVWAWAKNARLQPIRGQVCLAFEWREPDQRRDPDNIAAAKKFINDGLVMAGVIEGDRWKNVASLTDTWTVDARNPGCLVTITPADVAGKARA